MKNFKLYFLVLTILLSSCVAAVIAGAAGSVVVYDRRSVVMVESDARIYYRVNKTIVSDPRFHGSHIVVSSFNESVLLAGQTSSSNSRALAEKIAKSVPNVRRVYNEITIQPASTFTQRSKDSLITGQLKADMLTQKGLESGSIHIITENNTVYLMGIVTKEQADLAVHVARQVVGVNKVVKVFRYIV